MIQIFIDDKQIQQFIKKSPARATWALKESFGKTGGHFRKKLKTEVLHGRYPLDPLSEIVTKGRREHRPPLALLNRIIFFKVRRRVKRSELFLQIGYMEGVKGLGQRLFGGYFQTYQIARVHEYGKRTRVTDRTRGRFARMGYPLKKETKFIKIPARPVIALFYNRHKNAITKYIEKAFFDVFFSNRNKRLKI